MKNNNLDTSKINTAYFSAEIGLHASLPTYSGGLGVLAGDHIKASTDLGVGMVAVSLFYKEGYFKQELNQSGVQTESYPLLETKSSLKRLDEKVKLVLRGREVWIQAYEFIYEGEEGNSTRIYFLDTDIDQNHKEDRVISMRLYSGGQDRRLLQEAVLGFGGIKLLNSIGYNSIETYHMNEGHCSLLTLALLDELGGDEEKVRSACHFTTHTPVDAGHDHFSIDRSRRILGNLLPSNLNLSRLTNEKRLHMTELGLYFSRSSNGVSELHGEVAQRQFPEFKIDYITNGVHHSHWIGSSYEKLFDQKIPGWRMNPEKLMEIENISDQELLRSHQNQKSKLLKYVESETGRFLSEEILTIGFARRAAEYKRATLIFSDIDRLIGLGKGKLQIIFSGKAHPKDIGGKKIIEEIFSYANSLRDHIEIVFLENYNMKTGKLITSGVDVWLNTPLRPNEASGTSGMKAVLNGVPNLSILDGWWAEGYEDNKNGWAIGNPDICSDEADSDSLYSVIEKEVVPLYYGNKAMWISMMRNSIKSSVKFTAHRMLKEYQRKFYLQKS